MAMRCPLPARASFRDLLRDLLGREVQVRPGEPQELDDERSSYLAAYRFDEGDVGALLVTDLRFSASAAASIAAMPADETWNEVQGTGTLDEELTEFLHEVVNITAKLLNSPTTPHVVLRDHVPVPGEVSEDVAELALSPQVRHDWQVMIDGYGEGSVTFLG